MILALAGCCAIEADKPAAVRLAVAGVATLAYFRSSALVGGFRLLAHGEGADEGCPKYVRLMLFVSLVMLYGDVALPLLAFARTKQLATVAAVRLALTGVFVFKNVRLHADVVVRFVVISLVHQYLGDHFVCSVFSWSVEVNQETPSICATSTDTVQGTLKSTRQRGHFTKPKKKIFDLDSRWLGLVQVLSLVYGHGLCRRTPKDWASGCGPCGTPNWFRLTYCGRYDISRSCDCRLRRNGRSYRRSIRAFRRRKTEISFHTTTIFLFASVRSKLIANLLELKELIVGNLRVCLASLCVCASKVDNSDITTVGECQTRQYLGRVEFYDQCKKISLAC